jgi:hypothetical protein
LLKQQQEGVSHEESKKHSEGQWGLPEKSYSSDAERF